MVNFNPGGAVAAASVMYLVLSLLLGLVQRYLNPPLWLVTLIFVPAAFALVMGRHDDFKPVRLRSQNLGRADYSLLRRGFDCSCLGACCSRVVIWADLFFTPRSRSASSESSSAVTKFSNPLSRRLISAG